MKRQEEIGFVMFLLVILSGMTLIQRTAKAQVNIERRQALEIAADYIQPSRNPYIKVDSSLHSRTGSVQESSDDFNDEIAPKAGDALVSEMFVDKSTGWMGSAMMMNMPRMMGGRMGMMMRPMAPSTRRDTVRAFETSSAQMGPMMMGSGVHLIDEKSPGVAALLSLQPMPVALGNFYTDDWEKGALYTTLEVGMFIPGMILIGDRYSDHFHNRYERESWTDAERTWFISLATGYVAFKLISAFDAAYSAERHIRRGERVSLKVSPEMDGWALKTRLSF